MYQNFAAILRRLCQLRPVWPDWAIYCTLGNLPKSPTFLGNFCKGVKILNFSSEIILGTFYRHLAILIWSHWQWLLYISTNNTWHRLKAAIDNWFSKGFRVSLYQHFQRQSVPRQSNALLRGGRCHRVDFFYFFTNVVIVVTKLVAGSMSTFSIRVKLSSLCCYSSQSKRLIGKHALIWNNLVLSNGDLKMETSEVSSDDN